jgi:ethanolamine utilization protein EutL
MIVETVRIAPKILSVRALPRIDRQLAASLGCGEQHISVGMVTCDQDDAMYAALDHATKIANVDVVYAKSFYAGSAHASGPYSGEVLGVIAGADPDEVAEGIRAIRRSLAEEIAFHTFPGEKQPAFFAHVIASTGRYLSAEGKFDPGTPMAYVIAPPMESIVGLDAALKVAPMRMARHFGPPTETNFGGGYLVGTVADVEAAARAFVEAVADVSKRPLAHAVK